MSKAEITNKDIYEKLEEIRKLINAQLTMSKLLNSKAIEDARGEILKLDVRKKIFDLCDNKKKRYTSGTRSFPRRAYYKIHAENLLSPCNSRGKLLAILVGITLQF